MEKKLLIIDADSIIYYIAYNFRNKKVKKMVELNVNKFISDLLTNSGATDYIGFYASKEEDVKPNFRYDIYEGYKSNRPPTPDFVLKWRSTIHEVFKNKWSFIPVEGMEADDAVGICYTHFKDKYDEVIIATADKDLRQFSCTFYDFKKHEMTAIDEFTAEYNRYYQLLMGDAGDHIPGIPGVGKAGAKKILKNCKTVGQLKIATIRAYCSFENTLKTKITKEVIKTYKESMSDDDAFNALSEAKQDRKIRLQTKDEINEKIRQVLPLPWKDYLRQQNQLISMLTEAPDWFEIPDPVASPFGDIESAKGTTLTKEERKEAITRADDFLII